MAPYPRAAISGRGSPRYQARFGHSTLVSWQLIVENEPTGRFVSRPRGRVTLIKPQRDADARGQPQSLDGQRVGCCPQANACAAGGAGSMAKAFSGPDTSTLRSEKHRLGTSIHSRRPGPARLSKRLLRPGRRDVGPSRSGLRGIFNKTHRFYQGPTHLLHGRRISASSSDVAVAKRLRGRFAETRLVVAAKPSKMAKLKRVCDGGDRPRTLSPTG
jgi:hypothetical protein